MKEIVLAKIGELVLKGLNRKSFENILLKNIKRRLQQIGRTEIKYAQSTIYIEPLDSNILLDDIVDAISKIFGIVSIAKAAVVEKKMNQIEKIACEYLKEQLDSASTFKVETKRADKKFHLKSPEISAQVGGAILKKFPHIKVNVHSPDIIVTVEIRDFAAYVRGNAIKGAGGLPVGTGGKAAILISGGIDSPVAAWMMSKRGVELCAIHFASPPYTSERAEKKVVSLLKKVSEYSGRMTMYTVPFTEIQVAIRDKCPEELFTIIMRRLMFEISTRIAIQNNCSALITGESLGQVASQTIGAIQCVDVASGLPVFRPLIGMDKDEIVAISRKINTFDISIEPYEDCCTVFTPKHPRTKPILKYVVSVEKDVPFNDMIETALKDLKVTTIVSN